MGHAIQRLDSVDGHITSIDGRLRTVETGLATLTERVSHLPSKGFIVKAALGIVGALTTAIALQDKIQALIGH